MRCSKNDEKARKIGFEFSKFVVIVSNVIVFGLSVFIGVYCWRTGDSSPLAYLIPAIFTFTTTTNASYMWKSKNENLVKLPYYLEGGFDDDRGFEGGNTITDYSFGGLDNGDINSLYQEEDGSDY